MRAHFLLHVPFEGPGSIERWLRRHRYGMSATRLYESSSFPDFGEFDVLIVMGGPMSVNDEKVHDWLVPEKRFIERAIEADKRVLGICLGAQLIANSLGASVSRNEHKEIGWFPIRTTQPAVDSPIPDGLEVFHWHGETFEIPKEAVRLAESDACANQAFQLGRNVIGLQFHLETTPESARQIVSSCHDELRPSRYVQPSEVILGVPAERYEKINTVMAAVIAHLLEPAS
jgi:GMP synthase-like glutamine amidotransferase